MRLYLLSLLRSLTDWKALVNVLFCIIWNPSDSSFEFKRETLQTNEFLKTCLSPPPYFQIRALQRKKVPGRLAITPEKTTWTAMSCVTRTWLEKGTAACGHLQRRSPMICGLLKFCKLFSPFISEPGSRWLGFALWSWSVATRHKLERKLEEVGQEAALISHLLLRGTNGRWLSAGFCTVFFFLFFCSWPFGLKS